MAIAAFTEDTLVQQTTADYLKESTWDAVHVTIRDFLWSDETGLPTDGYSEDEVAIITDNVFRHVFRVYPEVPSPYYESAEAA